MSEKRPRKKLFEVWPEGLRIGMDCKAQAADGLCRPFAAFLQPPGRIRTTADRL